jgi:predicted regulator of Ras-like GTPase activity (Roadblock/LC7/MglB family)
MHAIKRNHGREHPRNLIFVDTEAFGTDQSLEGREHRLMFRLAVAQCVRHNGSEYIKDERMQFMRPADFWNWAIALHNSKTVVWIFAHNLWFDMTMLGIQQMMDDGRVQLVNRHRRCKACSEGSCKSCKCWKGSISLDPGASFATVIIDAKRFNLVDSFNYYRSSLEEIGESHGIVKLPMPAELDGMIKWAEYCNRDVDILQTAMCELIRNWYMCDLGNFQLTAPGLAFSCYRHRFMNHSIVPHNNKDVTNDEASAYFGGETTVFFRGRITQTGEHLFDAGGERRRDREPEFCGPVYHVDCNSLYPHVMREQLYPAMYLGSLDHPRPSEVEKRLGDYCIVANVRLTTSRNTYPFRCGGRTWYPTGDFWTTLCTPELRYAFTEGDVAEVALCHVYEKKPLFADWVDFWYKSKELHAATNDKAAYEFDKLLLTSLSGKFAQKKRHWRIDSHSMPLVEWGRWPRYLKTAKRWEICRALGKLVQVQEHVDYADHALVAISAHITSAGRVYMKEIRDEISESMVLYQDTDSLFLTQHGYDSMTKLSMIHDTQLGKFKLRETILEGGIYGRQDYESNGTVVKAGLPRDATRESARSWRFNKIESPESMMSRMPDGTVIVSHAYISSSELCSGRSYGDSGRSVPRNAVSIMRECGILAE